MFDHIFALGDIHGAFWDIEPIIRKYCLRNAAIFLVGDMNIGFKNIDYKKYFDVLEEDLEEYNIKLYLVRGNHDNPKSWKEKHTYENIIFVNDYNVLDFFGEKVLVLGGAISVDRTIRVKTGKEWFIDEKFQLDIKKLKEIEAVDYVVSHTSPQGCFPLIMDKFLTEWCQIDPCLRKDVLDERVKLAYALERIKDVSGKRLKKWIHGHFHKYNNEIIKDVEFVSLGISELYSIY